MTRFVQWPGDILQIWAPEGSFFVLRDGDSLFVIDGGFIGGRSRLARGLRKAGWAGCRIRGIIVTHGHLDHTLNVARLAREHGAWIAAPRLDADHYAGRHPYRGWSRVAGLLEAIGRPVLGYQPFVPDRWLDDGDVLEIEDGLVAVHLPGHTDGHMGFFCRKKRWLFTADLFMSYRSFAALPPDIFNSHPERLLDGLRRALALKPAGVLPNHGGIASPEEHLARLQRLHDRTSAA